MEIEDVQLDFGERPVLRGATLRVAPGEVVGLTGANGVGKSTLLRVACGLLRPRRGRAAVDGIEAPRARRRGWIGWSPPGEASFTRRLTLRANLAAAARLSGLRGAAADARVEDLAEAFGFALHLDVAAERCSSGTRQRAALARALLHRPRLIALDEPLRAVDARSAPLLAKALREAGADRAMLWVTHSVRELDGIADRVLVLEDGRLRPLEGR